MNEEAVIKVGNFEGFAVVEMMGHRKEIGFVTTESYGAAVLFRVDSPGLPEREHILKYPEYIGSQHCPAGTKVIRGAVAPRTCLVAPGSLYALNPCTESAMLAALEATVHRPLQLVDLPALAALPQPENFCGSCDGTAETGHTMYCDEADED